MAQGTPAQQIMAQRTAQGWPQDGEIDQAAVDGFIADAREHGTPAQNIQIAERIEKLLARGERMRGVNLPTMAATADALRSL